MLRAPRMATVVLVLLAACAPESGEDDALGQGSAPEDSQGDVQAIRQVVQDEIAAAEAGDTEGFMALMTDDVVVLAPDQPTTRGADARSLLQGMFEAVEIDSSGYTDDEIVISGDLAYHTHEFQWTLTPRDGGEPTTETGHGVHVLRRQPDGSWKIAVDAWSMYGGESGDAGDAGGGA